MFEIKISEDKEIELSGRLSAAEVDKASKIFDEIKQTCSVNFQNLEYISSAGLSVLLKTQKRLNEIGHQLKLKNMNNLIREIFKYAGFDTIFEIE